MVRLLVYSPVDAEQDLGNTKDLAPHVDLLVLAGQQNKNLGIWEAIVEQLQDYYYYVRCVLCVLIPSIRIICRCVSNGPQIAEHDLPWIANARNEKDVQTTREHSRTRSKPSLIKNNCLHRLWANQISSRKFEISRTANFCVGQKIHWLFTHYVGDCLRWRLVGDFQTSRSIVKPTLPARSTVFAWQLEGYQFHSG